MDIRSGFSFAKFFSNISKWGVDLMWFFKNISKARTVMEGAFTHAPFCPRHEARMDFQNEQPYVVNDNHFYEKFRRNYKCPLCQYTTFTIFQVKNV
jgi:hypothetical protein